jgi:hypothetical protein
MTRACSTHREMRNTNLKQTDHSEDPGLNERIILKWILEKWVGRVWTGFIWLRIGPSCRLFETW